MTIKKISMSIVALAAISSAAYAAGGTLEYSNGIAAQNAKYLTIGQEYAETHLGKDLNGSINMDGNNTGRTLVYKANVNKGVDASVSQANVYIVPVNGSFTTKGSHPIDTSTLQLMEVNSTNPTVPVKVIGKNASIDGNGDLLFANTTGAIQTGHTYALFNTISDNNTTAYLPVTPASGKKITDVSLELTVVSSSGTSQVRDDAKTQGGELKPQFTVTCAGKLDGMINFENGSHTFVTTGHGASDQNTTDQLLFNVNDNTNGLDFALNDSNITINAVADGNLSEVKSNVNVTNTNLKIVAGAKDSNITITTTQMKPGMNSFAANFEVNGTSVIHPVKFTDVNATLYNTNKPKYSQIQPASYKKGASLGQWQNYTYVAQIPAATADSQVDTKIFMVNRSCSNVMPTFRVIKDGYAQNVPATDVSNLKNFTSNKKIAVDTQGYVFVSNILQAAHNLNPNIPATGKCAIEVVLPGIAESYYVTAQAKNMKLGQFKVLPVYSTSTRTN